MICCPYHRESNPSFRVELGSKKYAGFGKCYACGKSAPFNEWAKLAGMKPLSKEASLMGDFAIVPPLIKEVKQEKVETEDIPKNKKWRGISTNLLIDIGCKIVHHYGTKFISMPVNVNGEKSGEIKARIKKIPEKPSYINSPGIWTRTNGLFPFDYVVENFGNSVCVLTEGPRDALRLIENNIPAICIFGVHSWSKEKAKYLNFAFEKIILCMDGDCAGIEGEKTAKSFLQNQVVESFCLYGKDSPYHKYRNREKPKDAANKDGIELWDAFNMPKSKVQELQKFIKTVKYD